MSRPRYKSGLPFLPTPQKQAFGNNLFHEGPGCAGEGVALGWEPCCEGVCMAGNPRDAFGCLVHLWREQHPGLQAGREQGTGGHPRGVMWEALNGLGVHWCKTTSDTITSHHITSDVIVVLPLLGRTVCSVTPLHLPAVLLAFPGQGDCGAKAEEPMQRPLKHFTEFFPSPPAPIYVTKAESWELALLHAV